MKAKLINKCFFQESENEIFIMLYSILYFLFHSHAKGFCCFSYGVRLEGVIQYVTSNVKPTDTNLIFRDIWINGLDLL